MSRRTERISEQILQEVGLLLVQQAKDPRVAAVTLTGVEVSPDLSHARLFYSVIGDEKARRDAALGLRSTSPWLRRELARSLHLRKMPDLEFRHDDTASRAEVVDRLLERIQEEGYTSEASKGESEEEGSSSEVEADLGDPGDPDEAWEDPVREAGGGTEDSLVLDELSPWEDAAGPPPDDDPQVWQDDGTPFEADAEEEVWSDDGRGPEEEEEAWEEEPGRSGRR